MCSILSLRFHACYLLLWQNKREKSSNFRSLEINATDRENTGTVTHVTPPQRVRMLHQNLSVKSPQIRAQVFHFPQLHTRPKVLVYLTTAPVFTPSVVNGVSDKERKLRACEINLAGPLVPEDKENKLFRNYCHAVRREGLRSSLHRYDHDKSCTISWKQTLNAEYTENHWHCRSASIIQ